MAKSLIWFPETISVTQDLDLAANCPYKHFILRMLNYRKRVFNIDLVAGGEMAKAFELTRKAFYAEGQTEADSIALGEDYILNHFGDLFASSGITEAIKNPTTLGKVFVQYFKRFPLRDGAVVPFTMPDGKISVEQTLLYPTEFKHPITGKPIVIKAILDLLGKDDYHTYVVDEKTCKSLLTDHAKQGDLLRTERQFSLYVALFNLIRNDLDMPEVSHFKVRKVVLNATAFKNGKVAEEYEFAVDKGMQARIFDNTMRLIQGMLDTFDRYMNDGSLPLQNFSNSCTSYFRPCEFCLHCTSSFFSNLETQEYKQIVQVGENRTEVSLKDFLTKRGLL